MTENEIFDKMLDARMDEYDELLAYRAIGTIEEFKVLKEEVELYRNLDKTNFSDGYNKAIDEFAEKLSLAFDETIEEHGFYPENLIRQVTEQLKAGVENGKNSL